MKLLHNNSYPLSGFYLRVIILLFLALPRWVLQANAAGNDTDKLSLLKFKDGITNDPNGIFGSWNDSLPFCNWIGVTCGRQHQRVTALVLKSHELVGSVSPYIGNLSFLRLIDLMNNSLTGEVPREIGKLFRLEQLFLNNNTLGGGIPANLTGCTKLRILYLMFNNMGGEIPPGLGPLVKLERIQISSNNFSGELPSTLGNITSLTLFTAAFNKFVGKFPDSMGRLPSLEYVYIGDNNIAGTFPPALFNISSIIGIATAGNPLNGSLPEDMGLTLPNLQIFAIADNKFYGSIPSSISNATRLQIFDISDNNFVGQVPSNLGNLQNLWWLNLGGNSLGSNATKDLDFITSLQNCTNLDILFISGNHFGGILPSSIGNLSVRLSKLYLADNQFTGSVPEVFGNLVNLIVLAMANNLFTGGIPTEFAKLQKLQVFGLEGNRLSGSVPSFIGNLTRLVKFYASQNRFEGSLPSSIGNLQNLIEFDLAQNNFSGVIPQQLLGLSSLSTFLNLSKNAFTGNLSAKVGKLTHLSLLDVSENSLSGEIPITIGNCYSLQYLYMQGNFFQGSIPSSLSSLESLEHLDLSRNHFTGEIPKDLQNLTYLSYLNVSFNDLEGEVPTEGVFRSASSISLIGNAKLCGGVPELGLPRCATVVKKKGKSLGSKLKIILICVILFVLSLLAFLILIWSRKSKKNPSSEIAPMGLVIKVSYKDLYQATNGFSACNLIGSGSFGYVYRGLLDQVERPVAIKVLNLRQKGASKSFEAECNALRNIRHRNLLKIITNCSSLASKGNDFKALVFEYMENGSLEKWLHLNIDSENQSKSLNLLQRLNIAIDVASAMHYLHDLCEVPIIHRDLKPSNVLIDGDMVAHVGDFGLARLHSITGDFSQSQTNTTGIKGTIGYAAPEYAMGGVASKEADVYSYGILLLEMFTGRRPTDEIFRDSLNLRNFVNAALPERLETVIDQTLIPSPQGAQVTQATAKGGWDGNEVEENGKIDERGEDENTSQMRTYVLKCLLSVLEIGVSCSAESARERMSMSDVTRELHSIKSSSVASSV